MRLDGVEKKERSVKDELVKLTFVPELKRAGEEDCLLEELRVVIGCQ